MDSRSTDTISVEQLATLAAASSINLVDVRTPAEYREVHATMAQNVPLESLDPDAFASTHTPTAGNEPVYVICLSGSRSENACRKLRSAGVSNVVSVEGGTKAWERAGLPVVRGKKTVSLERQVRMLAGFIVLTGAILAMTVHSWFAGISAFIGAGLMFAESPIRAEWA